MNWKAKALLQKFMSAFPAHEQVNFLFQKFISRNLPVSDETLIEKIQLAAHRIDVFHRFSTVPLDQAALFEFGAGWDMIGPIAMYAFGADKQRLADIEHHVRLPLINDALERIEKAGAIPGRITRSLPVTAISSIEELNIHCGIEYNAPCDARSTGLPPASIDYISTNSTLEHIPQTSIVEILKEAKRILKAGGVMYHLIDMKDHFSYFDRSITKYNFLIFDEKGWERYNSKLQYQNRLRLPEYQQMILEAGFEIVWEEVVRPSQEELSAYRKLTIDHSYTDRYSEEEITAQIYRIVARKPFD